MTEQEKQLLSVDLCARLPYGIFVKDGRNKLDDDLVIYTADYHPCINDCKPFLRPMSSMTEEELDELLDSENSDFDGKSELVKRAMTAYIKGDKLLSNALFSMQYAKTIDWLNSHHFDYRGLIKKGLALEAPEGMYVIK